MATIKIGLVGCGGRGRGAAQNALQNTATKDVKLVAVADAFQDSVDGTVKLFSNKYPNQTDIPKEQQFVGLDCCEKLLKTDVDVVLLCEPPGFRSHNFVAAIDSGKHVFAEKPVAVDSPGVRRFLAANAKAKEKKQIVLVGHHLRFEKKHYESINMIHEGAIGDLLRIRIFFDTGYLWTRPRLEGQTEMEHQIRNWYYFNWLSGDHIVEQHVHDIDVMNWFMKDQHPIEANGMGGRQVRIGRQFGEIFDHHSVEYVFEERGVRGYSDCRQINGCWGSFSEHAYGTKGYINMDGHGTVVMKRDGKDPITWKRETDGHQTEMDVLFDAIANGKEFNNGNIGADATMTAILGRMATYSGKVVQWDDAFKSELDLFPKTLAWDADPGPKPDAQGIYPCAKAGVTQAW
ncbi:MAG: Gfo/Idh/MocA family oxidoreductase [Planctomycetaceae bacterium]|jgi:predicted dehydrogenase|nr:Gfo/Idh/MocA family oxidoreductase [Planctomycetaceae bacterium]